MATPNADRRLPTRSSRGIFDSGASLVAPWPFRTQLVENGLERGIRFQQGWPHDLTELAPGLAQLFVRGLDGGVSHRFLMGRSQLRALFLA